ncbi:aminotransferase class I/II-fold pyridoxal phosphate-dependent enzyme [bacterium]|nr:aminotransferase class I/II-fold pyridoxal phosphate-dependent enzyme [bacterium]
MKLEIFNHSLVSTSLSPNTEKDDVLLALKMIFRPRKWKQGEEISILENEFKNYFKVNEAVSFNSGRSAFLAILKSFDLKEGEEVLFQAFTCNAVVNPIMRLKLKPVFVDCDESFNIDPKDLKEKITEKSKVVIVQHTFGQPAKMDEVLKICKDNNLILIEDCAHSLGAEYKGKKVGTFGKAAFFSFGRDKVISSVFGGMAITNDSKTGKKIRNFQRSCDFPSSFWVFQQLLHPILMHYIILPAYHFPSFGKFVLNFFQIFKILSKAVDKKEKEGKLPSLFPKRLPNALAILALNQLRKLEKFNIHRERIAKVYSEGLRGRFEFQGKVDQTKRIFMRFPILVDRKKDTERILVDLRKNKVLLNDGWRKTSIVPPDTDQKKMRYIIGSCPRAEEIAKRIINLPTHINISEKEARIVIKSLLKYVS